MPLQYGVFACARAIWCGVTASQTPFAVSINAAFLAGVEAAMMISHDTVRI
jgi:hypothetical protein